MVFVVADQGWFKNYGGEPVYVLQRDQGGWIGFDAVLVEETGPAPRIDPNGREHRWFRCERVVPDTREKAGVIKSATMAGNVTARIGILCGDVLEVFHCRKPLKAEESWYYEWKADRMKRGIKSWANPVLKVYEYQYGGGPLGRLARSKGGLKKLKDIEGMRVSLKWNEGGVCDLFPFPATEGGQEYA